MRLTRIALPILLALMASQAQAADLWRPKGQPGFMDSNGDPIVSGKLCYYDATTTDEKTVYKDADESDPWSQPITLDSGGALSDPIYMPTGAFKEVFKDSDATTCDDGTTLFSSDEIPGALDVSSLDVAFAKPEQPTLNKATDYVVTTDDLGSIIDVNATGGNVTITLPPALSATDGQIVVRKVDSSVNTVSIAVVGSADIDGQSSQVLSSQYDRLAINSDGANWYTLSGVPPLTVTFGKLAASAYSTSTTMASSDNTTLPTTLAIKTYVDTAIASGIKWKDPVRLASTANVVIATALENGDTIDGVVLATNDRVLLKDQSTGAQNGIYVASASGAASRSTDADTAAEINGATVYVSAGTANTGRQYTQSATIATIGVETPTFTLIAAANTYTADGTTLTLTGQQFSVKSGGIGQTQIATDGVGASEIAADSVSASEIAADAVGASEIAADAVGSSEIATGAIILAGAGSDVTGSLAVANGGTAGTTAATARTNLGLGTAAVQATGTSGATLPFLNGTNTWSSGNTFSSQLFVKSFSGSGASNGWQTDTTSGQIQISRASAATVNHIEFYNTNGLVGTITTNSSGTAYNTTSDERLKKDFVPATDVGAVLDGIHIYNFEWKSDGKPGFGPKAQELYEVLPGAVSVGHGEPGDKDFQPWTWDASKLVPYLIVEIQSLRKRVDELEASRD